MDYVHQSHLDTPILTTIRKRLKKNKIRSQYKKALVYQPQQQKYVESDNRLSRKATFHDETLVRLLQPHVPQNIDIPTYEHIDIVHYSTGQYFKEHRDFVNTYPHYAQQVTIIIGLQNAKRGGTRLHVHGKSIVYEESIRRGGVLIFHSTLPHAGDVVIGEKEILVFTGYLFERRVPTLYNTLVYCKKVDILAIHKKRIVFDMPFDEDHNNIIPPEEQPYYYIYINNVFVAVYNSRTDMSHRIKHGKQCNLQKEQLKWMNMPLDIDESVQHYPILRDILRRKNIMDCFHQCKVHHKHNEIKYTYEKEFCNGYDDYDVIKIPEMSVNTLCQHFSMAIFDERYYTYWLNKWKANALPKHIVHFILEYVAL